MRKVLPVAVSLVMAAIACEEKTPTGPSRVEEITAAPNAPPVVSIAGPAELSFAAGTRPQLRFCAFGDSASLKKSTKLKLIKWKFIARATSRLGDRGSRPI